METCDIPPDESGSQVEVLEQLKVTASLVLCR
jgi:hypothetical protein